MDALTKILSEGKEMRECPFCGSPEAIYTTNIAGTDHFVVCVKCKSHGPVCKFWGVAIERWNYRANEPIRTKDRRQPSGDNEAAKADWGDSAGPVESGGGLLGSLGGLAREKLLNRDKERDTTEDQNSLRKAHAIASALAVDLARASVGCDLLLRMLGNIIGERSKC